MEGLRKKKSKRSQGISVVSKQATTEIMGSVPEWGKPGTTYESLQMQ